MAATPTPQTRFAPGVAEGRLPLPLAPKQIAGIRSSLNASQGVFASYLGVSKAAVVAWEYGIRQPSGAARKLLSIARKNPEILLEARSRFLENAGFPFSDFVSFAFRHRRW